MAAVFGEVEHNYAQNDSFNDSIVNLGVEGRALWRELLDDLGGSHAITAEDTIVYLQDRASDFETRNFDAVVGWAEAAGCLESIDIRDLADVAPQLPSVADKAVRLLGEFSMDVTEVFRLLDGKLVDLNVGLIDSSALSVDVDESQVRLRDGRAIDYDRVVVAAGAHTAQILTGAAIQPMLQGVGTALLVQADPALSGLQQTVFRSVNRGGSNCGLHTVPRLNGALYVGAGNYISRPGASHHRLETVRYLFTSLEQELIGRAAAYPLTGAPVIGNRPKSIDGLPLIGPLQEHPNVVVATGMNRLGLTWSPAVATRIASWISSGASALSQFHDWRPDRALVPFGSDSEALDFFVESRIAAAMEHNLVGPTSLDLARKREEVLSAGLRLQKKLKGKFGLPVGMSLPPDHWNALIVGDESGIELGSH